MTITANATQVEAVVFNGTDCDKVYMNGALVFEKFTGPAITVEEWEEWGDVMYGWNGGEGLSDNTVNGSATATITFLKWHSGSNYGDLGASIGVDGVYQYPGPGQAPQPARIKITIGDQVLMFTNPYYQQYLISITRAQFDALPKYGTYPITIEVA